MMPRHLIAVCLCACLVSPAMAAGPKEERVKLLVSLICDAGGSMETSKAAEVLPKHGFTMKETQAIVAELEDRKLVTPTKGMATLKLKKKACR